MHEKLSDKRKKPRSKFAYPVKFTLFSPGSASRSFTGYIKNMSVGGVCIRFEDKYGRTDFGELNGSRIRVAIKVPQGEKIIFNALVHWIRKEDPGRNFFVLMGLEMKDVDDWQLDQIEKFISLKNKDHKMLWNLLDDHLQND